MALMGMFQWGVRQSAEVENQVCSLYSLYATNIILFLGIAVLTLCVCVCVCMCVCVCVSVSVCVCVCVCVF